MYRALAAEGLVWVSLLVLMTELQRLLFYCEAVPNTSPKAFTGRSCKDNSATSTAQCKGMTHKDMLLGLRRLRKEEKRGALAGRASCCPALC